MYCCDTGKSSATREVTIAYPVGYIPKRRIRWTKITVWRVLYKAKGGQKVVVTSLVEPEKYRTFRVASKGGERRFKAIKVKKYTKEVVFVMAATKSKNTKKKGKKKDEVISDEEIEELDSLEDLDEDEDEDEQEVDDTDDDDEDEDDESDDDDDESEDDDDEDDDEDDEDEAPKSKSKSKKKSSDGTIGSAEIAAACGIDGRKLRTLLRSKKGAKIRKRIQDPDTKQYRVNSINDPAVKELKKLVKAGAADEATKESLDKLKKSKSTGKKKSSTKKKKAADDE